MRSDSAPDPASSDSLRRRAYEPPSATTDDFERRVASEVRALQRDLPGVRPVLLHREVAHVRVVTDDQLDDGVDEVTGAGGTRVGGPVAVEHRDLGAVFGDHQGVRERREAVALRPVQHDDRLVDDDARGTFT